MMHSKNCEGISQNGSIHYFAVGEPLVGLRFYELKLRLNRKEWADSNIREWVDHVAMTRIADMRTGKVTIEIE